MEREPEAVGETGPPDEARVDRLARVVAECSDRLNAGQPLDRRQVLEENADLTPELELALAALEEMSPLVVEPARPRLELGEFRLVRELGRGGMGIVYEAWQSSLDRRVALKVLPPGLLAQPRAVSRFEREARAAARLAHPNIVSVHGLGVEDGTPYYVMEFVVGETLERVLERLRSSASGEGDSISRGRLSRLLRPPRRASGGEAPPAGGAEAAPEAESPAPPPGEGPPSGTRLDSLELDLKTSLKIAELFAGTAEGLQHAHQRGVVHRDLKPSNLILDERGRLRILDFGLARLEGQESLTTSGEFLGTPLYMSPEQAMARRVPLDHRTDIYSLGATLYEVLARRPPFRGRDHQDTLSQIITRDAPSLRARNPRIPRELETIVLKCLRKSPDDRYATAEALAQDLRRVVRGDPIEARPEPILERLARRAWRARWGLGTAALVLVAAVTSALLYQSHVREADRVRKDTYRSLVLGGAVKVQLGRPLAAAPASRSLPARPSPRRQRGGLLVVDLAFAEGLEEPAAREWDPVEEGAGDLERAVGLFPDRLDAHYHLARAESALGYRERALAEAESALRCDARFVPARALRQALLEQGGDSGAAASPPETPGPDGWGEAWLEAQRATSRRDWTAAIRAYTALLEAGEEGREPYLGLGLEALCGRGAAHLEAGDLDRALEDLAAARGRWPALVEPGLLVGKVYHLKGNPARSEEVFQEILARSPAKDEVCLKTARLLFSLREHAAALRWAERAPEGGARERLRASLLAGLDRLEEAESCARRALALEPGEARSREALGYVFYRQERCEEARDQFTAARELDPRSALVRVSLGHTLELLGRTGEAETELLEAARLDGRLPLPRIHLGDLRLRAGKAEEAAEEYRRALALDQGSARAWSSLGDALRLLERPRESLEAHGRALKIDPRRAHSHHNLALTLLAQNDAQGALEALRRAADIEPRDPHRHNQVGMLLATRLRLFAEAVAAYETALRIDPEFVPALYNRVLSLKELGEVERGLEAARRALAAMEGVRATYETEPDFRSMMVHTLDHLAGFARASGRPAEARAHALKALDLQKSWVDRPGAAALELNQYAWTLLTCEEPDLRDPAAALQYALRAVEGSPERDLPEFLDTLAGAYLETGDLEKAEAAVSRALGLLPASPRNRRARQIRKAVEETAERIRKARPAGKGQDG